MRNPRGKAGIFASIAVAGVAGVAVAWLGLRLIQSQKAMAVASATPDRKLAASLS